MTERTLDTWAKAVVYLKDRGIVKIIVDYSGSGDSGAIDDCTCYDSEDHIITVDSQSNLDDIINLTYPMLDDIEDWYNNDGGYGQVIINLDDLSYEIENNIRYYECETYTHNGDLQDLFEK